MPRLLLRLDAPKPSLLVVASGYLGRHTRGMGRRDGTRHQQGWQTWRPWSRLYSPPGETGPDHQAPAPCHGDDMTWPPTVGLERPDNLGATPWPPCQQRAPPHTPPPICVLALGHALQDLALEVRRDGRLEQAE